MMSWSEKLYLCKQVILALGIEDSFSSSSTFQLKTLLLSIWVESDNRSGWRKEG